MKDSAEDILKGILAECGGSTTEFARRLTNTDEYYTPNQVAYWIRVNRIPAEHGQRVAAVFGLDLQQVVPYLFSRTEQK